MMKLDTESGGAGGGGEESTRAPLSKHGSWLSPFVLSSYTCAAYGNNWRIKYVCIAGRYSLCLSTSMLQSRAFETLGVQPTAVSHIITRYKVWERISGAFSHLLKTSDEHHSRQKASDARAIHKHGRTAVTRSIKRQHVARAI